MSCKQCRCQFTESKTSFSNRKTLNLGICPKCGKKLHLRLVFKALKMYFVYKLSLRQIKKELSLVYPKAPSPVAILNWVKKCGYLFSLVSNNEYIQIKNPPKIWLIDDSVIKIKGQKFRLFVVLGYSERVVLAWYLAPTKDKEVVKMVLKLALDFIKEKPLVCVLSFALRKSPITVLLVKPFWKKLLR